MKTSKTILAIWMLAALAFFGTAHSAFAQDVELRLSSREAYVGQPIVMQIAIQNASDYEQPTLPKIDNVDIRSAGAPSQSSQITIINGRRSESRSVVMQYMLTPRRAGTFEVPSFSVNVDGRDVKTKPFRFIATKSETGDLLLVEIEGGKDKVFVGEPLDMTLKIWVKPFRDRKNNITLTEANMWQMISKRTSWGSFAAKLQEMAENRQRPAGREVVRDNGQSGESSYYLYEIEGTVYPKRPGRIEADNVQIVVDYPTAIGKARDPFGDFFGGRDPFGSMGGSSMLRQMVDDDFFSSPFSNRLSVSDSRPIVAEATVDLTEVVDIPTEGRPEHYRGAVGRYNIATQAMQTEINAGDPIELRIGIVGTGPMELVQAPPLESIDSLTSDFKVNETSLAGFVQDNAKVFPTTIRPRREGITEIPAIPFSFFDPATESFETVMSQPISITVNKAESLTLDSIVANNRRASQPDNSDSTASFIGKIEPNFDNNHSANVLVSQSANTTAWWWAFVIVPPILWLVAFAYSIRGRIGIIGLAGVGLFCSARQRAKTAVSRASESHEIEDALIQYISRRASMHCNSNESAVGAIRSSGFYQVAVELETFFQRCLRFGGTSEPQVNQQETAISLIDKIETAFANSRRSQVRKSKRTSRKASHVSNIRAGSSAQKASGLLFAAAIALAGNNLFAQSEKPSVTMPVPSNQVQSDHIELTGAQRETILQEAGEAYARGRELAGKDSAEASVLLSVAAEKYQMLVDSGVTNAQLFMNLGNAYLQSGQLGHAIANYERARQFGPLNSQINVNLDFAKEQVVSNATVTETPADSSTFLVAIATKLKYANDAMIETIGLRPIVWTLVISSILFWSLLTVQTLGVKYPAKRLAVVPLLVLVVSAVSVWTTTNSVDVPSQGIVVAKQITLRSGDGSNFKTIANVENADGQSVGIIGQRGEWMRIEASNGKTGWVKASEIAKL